MSDRRTASYAAVHLPNGSIVRAIRDASFARPASERIGPPLCRCADPQAVVVSTGPVLCMTCGRRIGEP